MQRKKRITQKTVHLRERKSLKNGTVRQYLEIYLGTDINPDGKNKVNREYVYLQDGIDNEKKRVISLVLFDETKKLSTKEKEHNKLARKIAEEIRLDRQNKVNNNDLSFLERQKEIKLLEYYDSYVKSRNTENRTYIASYISMQEFLKKCNYSNSYEISQIDIKFIERYLDFLKHKTNNSNPTKQISNLTVSHYFKSLLAVLRKAFNEEIYSEYNKIIKHLENNPLLIPKVPKGKREYLTLDEIKLLSKSYLKNKSLKRAFLFSCLTGLRKSDIIKMKWSEIQQDGNEYKYIFKSQKTQRNEYLPISKQAIEILGTFGNPDELVFNGFKFRGGVTKYLTQWILDSGINKHITFHCARHTFATLQLTLGTEITVLSKLLGHSNINTTMIYAKIIDERKAEAMNKIPNLGITF